MTPTDKKDIPVVIIFAGPNGSGKSTITAAVVRDPDLFKGQYINADEIAKSLEDKIPDYVERNREAAGLAEKARLAALQDGRDFAFETVMSTPEKVALMTQAKALGYRVSLFFVTTEDPEINVQRVKARVLAGGHSVKPEDVRKRYISTMTLLPCAFEKADQAVVLDNSALSIDGEGTILEVASKMDEDFEFTSQAQALPWVTKHLIDPFTQRLASRKLLAAKAGGRPIAMAEAAHGKDYEGGVLAVTRSHVLQEINGILLEHDRALMATDAADLAVGSVGTVSYRYKFGKIEPVSAPTPASKTGPTPK